MDLEEGGNTDVEASDGESESETSSDTHTSTCSDQSNKSNRSNNSTCLTDDGEFCSLQLLHGALYQLVFEPLSLIIPFFSFCCLLWLIFWFPKSFEIE
jgi:hypothetical protein